ncbi:hypothetical protein [Jeotgalibacillus proteolyticus]|nr:hypothetical protein [Jeotgalibacillus proteolyticus]
MSELRFALMGMQYNPEETNIDRFNALDQEGLTAFFIEFLIE